MNKKILAITTITTLATVGSAFAQNPTSTSTENNMGQKMMQMMKGKMGHGKMHDGKDKHGDRKAIEDAIVAGDFTLFQSLASTSPLKAINQTVFNSLTTQFVAKRAAEDNIKTILKAAGIPAPTNLESKN